MWWLSTVALASSGPVAQLTWEPGLARFSLVAPEGEKMSHDGPASLSVAWKGDRVGWQGTGESLGAGIGLGDVRGAKVDVRGNVTLCSDANGLCRPVDVAYVLDVPDQKKGTVKADVHATDAPTRLFRTGDANRAADAAFAEARASGRPVLLDFGAVWCPPCNLLAAEVIDADPPPSELGRVVVASIDVDDPSSFAIKDQYRVGGYPTVIAVDADGRELARTVGYSGHDEFLAWLADAAARTSPAVDPDSLDPAATPVAEARAIAWRLVQEGTPEKAGRWVERAAAEPDVAELRLARMALKPTAADAKWLVANAPGRALEWTYGVSDSTDAGILASAREAVAKDLLTAEGPEVADLLDVRASLAPEAERPAWDAAALAALRAALSGDPELDRGYYTELADLQAAAGDLDGAIAFLDAQTAHWPGDPTFDLAAARLLNEGSRWDEARIRAERGYADSWGDNHLRVAAQLCAAWVGLANPTKAAEIAKDALASVPVPADGMHVRSFRYRTALEKYLPKP